MHIKTRLQKAACLNLIFQCATGKGLLVCSTVYHAPNNKTAVEYQKLNSAQNSSFTRPALPGRTGWEVNIRKAFPVASM